MSAPNQGNQQADKSYTGLEKDHGDTKKQQAEQSAKEGMSSGAVSVDHTKSGGSSGGLSGAPNESEARHVHS